MISQRKTLGLSQTDIAKLLNVSRPIIAKIEKGEKTLTSEQKSKLEKYFNSMAETQQDFRVNVPHKNIEKFKQVFLYVLEKVGAKPNVGLTVIYKLLYFIDFDYYERFEEQLMGLTYFKNDFGPTPKEFKAVVDEMIAAGEVEKVKSTYFKYEQEKFLPIQSPNLCLLNGAELEMVDSVLERYGDKTATQLSDISHRDTPWRATKDNQDIDYELAFYRPDEFSVGLPETL